MNPKLSLKTQIAICFIFLVFTLSVQGQNFSLLKDINDIKSSDIQTGFVELNGVYFFTANNGTNGLELWRTDGTTGGTYLVKDIYPGRLSSSPYNLISFNNRLYFFANGTELWKSDGTENGTEIVKNINQINSFTLASSLCLLGNILYFSASDGINGSELWRSDGTDIGTYLVKDINSGSASSNPTGLTVMGGNIYFQASNNTNGIELWKSDGTSSGTILLKDINNGTANSTPQNFTVLNNVLYFSASDGTLPKLFKSDGTANGTIVVKSVNGPTTPSTFFVSGNNLLFRATNLSTNTGSELWITDGTSSNTFELKDINAGTASSQICCFVNNGNQVYFSALTSSFGQELWKTDKTSNGTLLLKDIWPGVESSNPNNIVTVNNKIYFQASDSLNGGELWVSDGTNNGTTLYKDLCINILSGSNPKLITKISDTSFLLSADDCINGAELWIANTASSSITLLKDINTTTSKSSSDFFISELATNNNQLFISATDGIAGKELWKTDGTTSETKIVKDCNLGSYDSDPFGLFSMDSITYFRAFSRDFGFELWRSNGTGLGTYMLKDLNTGKNHSYITNFANINGKLVFLSLDKLTDGLLTSISLCTTDGTNSGTNKYFSLPTNFSSPLMFCSNGNLLFFSHDNTLWKTDGTATGTIKVTPSLTNLNPQNLVILNGVLYFQGFSSANGTELWRSDGTETGTYLLKDINTGANSGNPTNLSVINNMLYFAANDGTNGVELWRSDGTTNGTYLLKDINVGNLSSNPGSYGSSVTYSNRFFTNFSERQSRIFSNDGINFYFTATESTTGIELYISDGTANGTKIVRDISEPNTLFGNFIFSQDSRLFYTRKNQVWQSNGTTIGTTPIAESNFIDGNGSSIFVTPAAIMNNKLFVNVNNPQFGQELWVADINSILPLNLFNFSATLQDNSRVQLQWQTNNEVNVSHMNVQRSTDGVSYTVVGKVFAKGDSWYNLTDYSLPTTISTIYYRIETVDKDGSKNYSKAISVSLKNTAEQLNIFSNPITSNTLQFSFKSLENESIQATIFNAAGKLIQTKSLMANNGINAYNINLNSIATGMYTLQLVGKNISIQKQFLKQ